MGCKGLRYAHFELGADGLQGEQRVDELCEAASRQNAGIDGDHRPALEVALAHAEACGLERDHRVTRDELIEYRREQHEQFLVAGVERHIRREVLQLHQRGPVQMAGVDPDGCVGERDEVSDLEAPCAVDH